MGQPPESLLLPAYEIFPRCICTSHFLRLWKANSDRGALPLALRMLRPITMGPANRENSAGSSYRAHLHHAPLSGATRNGARGVVRGR